MILIRLEGSTLDAVDERQVEIRGEKMVARVNGRSESKADKYTRWVMSGMAGFDLMGCIWRESREMLCNLEHDLEVDFDCPFLLDERRVQTFICKSS